VKANRIIVWIFIICFGLNNSYAQVNNLPKDLNEAIEYFNKTWTAKEKNEFRAKPEADAVTDLHFSVGLWIRNNWIRGDRDKLLNDYFHKLGVPSIDDVSSIILTSLHRKLNSKPVDLQKQVDACKAAWKPVLDCERRIREQTAATYRRYKVGDHIKIFMYVDIMSNGEGNATTFACPTIDWKFDPKKDMIIQGVISEKYTFGSDSNSFFKVRIEKMNRSNTRIMTDTVRIGEVKNFSLQNLIVEKNTAIAHK